MNSRQTYQAITIAFVIWAILMFGIAFGFEIAGNGWGLLFIMVGLVLSGLAYFRSNRYGKA